MLVQLILNFRVQPEQHERGSGDEGEDNIITRLGGTVEPDTPL